MRAHTSPLVWQFTIVLVMILMLWFFWPQLSVLVFTALMAYVFYPLYLKLKRGKGTIAAVTTLIVSFLVIVIPLGVIAVIAALQLAHLAEAAGSLTSSDNLPDTVNKIVAATNELLAPITGVQPTFTGQSILDAIRTIVPAVAQFTAQLLLGIIATLPELGIALLIYIFVFVELLLHGHKLVGLVADLSPFDKKTTHRYLERTGLMTNAMVKGQLVISAILSLISATLLVPLGYGQYFFVFFILFTVLNFIPLGSSIVVYPLIIYSMITGQFWLGLVVFVLCLLAGNLDPILRARLIPKSISLSTGLTMVATFCGIAHFGMLGVVYGPLITVLIITTFELYRDLQRKGSFKAKLLRSRS